MSFVESKFELSKILSLLVILVVVATGIIWYAQLPEPSEFTYTGNVTEINFLGGGFNGIPQTLVRFDNGDTLLFRFYETRIPLNKEIKFYYYDNGFGKVCLNRFEVVK